MTRLLITMLALFGLAAPAVAQDIAPEAPVEAPDEDLDEPADESADDEPVAVKPADDEPAAVKPAADEPAAVKPADDEPAAVKPADEEPAADKPVAEEPADDEPVDDKPAADTDADEGEDDGDDVDGDDPDEAPSKAARPKSADPLSAFRDKDYAKARDAYLDRLDERPNAPALHYRVAVSAALADDPVIAEKHAAAVERLDPGNLKAQELAAAARVARTRANPPSIAMTQAEQALRDGRLRSAVRLATTALADADADAGALHRIRGEALLALGRADEAMGALQSAAALGHSDARLWLALGDAAKSVGDKARAAYMYSLAAQSAAPTDPVVETAAGRRKRLGKTRRR